MIADRDVFVVGEQRVVGAEDFTDAASVVDAGVEVGVVADGDWESELCTSQRVQTDVDAVLRSSGAACSSSISMSRERKACQLSGPKESRAFKVDCKQALRTFDARSSNKLSATQSARFRIESPIANAKPILLV